MAKGPLTVRSRIGGLRGAVAMPLVLLRSNIVRRTLICLSVVYFDFDHIGICHKYVWLIRFRVNAIKPAVWSALWKNSLDIQFVLCFALYTVFVFLFTVFYNTVLHVLRNK